MLRWKRRLPADLREEMAAEFRTWSRGTRNYGFTYYSGRILLIVTSAIVAADTSLKDSTAQFLVDWVPVLAIIVAVVTAIDTWLKPQQRWKGFMSSRDELTDLMLRAQQPDADEDELRKAFKELRKHHVESNVF